VLANKTTAVINLLPSAAKKPSVIRLLAQLSAKNQIHAAKNQHAAQRLSAIKPLPARRKLHVRKLLPARNLAPKHVIKLLARNLARRKPLAARRLPAQRLLL
jgi:hypothetical protein